MLSDFSIILIFTIIASLFIFGSLFIGRFLRPSNQTAAKGEAYECGELPIGKGWLNFNIRFYMLALIFVIFDVEAALMFPVAVVYKKWISNGFGVLVFTEVFIFIAILVVVLIYLWKKKDLEWIKTIDRE